MWRHQGELMEGEMREKTTTVEKCALCSGRGMDEFEADHWADYRYLPCNACNGTGRVRRPALSEDRT